MIKTNFPLCQSMNSIRFILFYYGRAMIDSSWYGTVPDPIYSRLFYITKGTATITYADGQILRMNPGNWYLLPAGCSFTYACEEMMEHVYFHFKLCDMDGIDLFRKCTAPCGICLPDTDINLLIRGLDSQSITDGLRIRQEAYRILMAFIDRYRINLCGNPLSPCIEKAVNYIRYHKSVNLSNQEIADQAFISVSTLTKRFHKELGMSVHEYIYDVVLLEAAQLLVTTDLPIAAISEKFHFCDQFYFSRRFREKFGVSPRAYRKASYI